MEGPAMGPFEESDAREEKAGAWKLGAADKVAGAVSRLYVGGWSWAEMVIGDDATPTPDPNASGDSNTTPQGVNRPPTF